MEESRIQGSVMSSEVREGILDFWSLEVPPRERVDQSLHPFPSQTSTEQARRRQCEPEKSCRGFCSHLCFLVQGASQIIADAVPTYTLLPHHHHTP